MNPLAAEYFYRPVLARIRVWQTLLGGQAQHVQSSEHVAFADEASLLSFIRHWVQMPEGSKSQEE